jgi:tetratricopeptide (TPR) repeat protein
MAYEGLGQYDKALASYAEAKRLNPKRSAAEIQRAGVLIKLQRHQDALQALQKVVRRKPDSAAAHKQLGDVYYHLERYDQAVEEYRAAVLNQADLVERHPELKRLGEAGGSGQELAGKLFKHFQAMAEEFSFKLGERRTGRRPKLTARLARQGAEGD